MGGFIAVTFLLALQVFMILLLLMYIYSSRVWTSTLDGLAIARIGQQLKDGGAIGRIGLRPPRDSDLAPLNKTDGLLGIVERDTELEMMRSSTYGRRDSNDSL